MRFDPSSGSRPHVGDQAEGLRQLRRPEAFSGATASGSAASGSSRVLSWPRIVLISEFPGTDIGARFAYHLASALGRPSEKLSGSMQSLGVPAQTALPAGDAQQSLLLDLAPAASRLPQVLSDRLPADCYPPLWSELAAGRALATLDIGGEAPLAVAAEHQLVPAVLDQLPRLYEQLVRQLSRGGARFGWIVMLALDHIVPLDRACWQAADDIVLLGGAGASGCHRQAAALRSRLSEAEPERSLWMLPKRRSVWLGRRTERLLSSRWLEVGLAPKLLPEVPWPHEAADGGLAAGSRADHLLRRSAARIADQLRAGCTSPLTPSLPTRRAS